MNKILTGALLLLFSSSAAAQTPRDSIAFATAQWRTADLGGGAECRYAQIDMFGSRQSISVATYPGRRFTTSIVHLDRRAESTSDLGKAAGAEIAVNGSYFNVKTFEPVTFVLLDRKIVGRTTPEDQRIIDQAIAYMELEEFQDRFIDELSGGQRQRALIAMVIAQDTEYVLLDEPTNNLDIYHATNMMRTVRKLCDELGKTVILVLHEINYAAFYSDYICAFVDGKVAKFGTVEEVMTKENLSAIYQVDFEILEIEGKPLSIYY